MALIVIIKVIPASGRNEWIIDKSGLLKAYLKSQPEKGLANKELVDLLSKALKIPKQKVTIISGATSRLKRVKIEGEISYDRLIGALGIERQSSLL